MRHHAKNVALLIHDPGNVIQRSVWIRLRRDMAVCISVPEDNLIIVFDGLERIGFCEEISFTMSDWDT